MFKSMLALKTGADVCDVYKSIEYAKWVRTPAMHVDTNTEMGLVKKLAKLMTEFRTKKKWNAVASQNIYWKETERPLRMMQIPNPDYSAKNRFITVVNPEIISKEEYEKADFLEGCGSLGEPYMPVARPKSMVLSGYVLEKGIEEEISISSKDQARYAHHELDHLEGLLIGDFGPVYGFVQASDKISPMFNWLKGKRNPDIDRMNGGLIFFWNLIAEVAFSGDRKYTVLDKEGEKLHLFRLTLNNEGKKLYWIAHYKKDSGVENADYGRPISFAIPDIAAVKHGLKKFPLDNYKSPSGFFHLPVEYRL
ncbi:TPA: hypothetical protein HA239_01630 [Candidatus Woesearchaeota archaeon]|nr:hypothetical protein QT06_C0001G0926 [archaeon GW2011_AR15]MBS3104592.1 peptide deformylase [Candidatus Woesearchaeota archaeon]HIH41093.1 hypothetical protein [Candidatus Woesearchaeota archaeon]